MCIRDRFVIGNDAGAARITQRENQPIIIATNDTTAMTITNTQTVGIGETSPDCKLHVRGGASGGGRILIQTDGAFAGTDEAKLDFRHYDDSGYPGGRISFKGTTNYTGDMVFKVRQGGTSGAGGAGLQEYMRIQSGGLVEVASYLKSKKGTIQTVVNQPTIYTSANPVNTWAEVNSNFRVSITPRFSSGTMILGTYSIPINPTGASNILMAIQPWYSTDGGTTKTILNQGGPSGSRLSGSHAWFRSSNGYDANDMQNHVVHFGYTHSATTTLTWGFYFRSEGSNTTYFCQSNGNSSLWGWTAPLYMELREVEVA